MRVLLNVTVQTSGLSTTISEEDGFINKLEQVTIASIMDGSIVKDKLEVGDIINSVTIGDKITKITRQYMFIDALLDARVGTDVKIGYTRNGQQETATITITKDCLTEY